MIKMLREEIKQYETEKKHYVAFIEGIHKKVDKLLNKIAAKVDVKDCDKNDYLELSKKLHVLGAFLDVKAGVKELDGLVKSYKNSMAAPEIPEATELKEDDLADAFRKCVTVQEIENKFQEFTYVPEEDKVMCSVCNMKVAGFSSEEVSMSGKVQSQGFRNLKSSLKKHLTQPIHTGALKESSASDKLEEKTIGRERKIGLVLGHVAFYLIKQGRPNSDFTTLVNILSAAGLDVGDLNHSSEFVANWGPVCASVIEMKLKRFLGTPLLQTGHRPPVKGVADKATWQHNTRMLCGLVTVVPDSSQLLQAFLTGTEVCSGSTGDDMTESLVKVWKQFIVGSQYNGLAADGATLHCHVGSKTAAEFGRRGHDDYDPLHKAGLVDVHMRSPGAGDKFKFLGEMNQVISSLNSFFNMGM